MTITHPRTSLFDASPALVLITTTRFGVLEVHPDQVFACPEGIPGFGDLGGLAVLPVDGDALFVWLHSTELAEVAFLAVNPWPFFLDYDIEIPDRYGQELGIENPDDVVVFCLARPDEDRRRFLVNLLAPIVGSSVTATMRQITLDGDHPIAAPLELPESPLLGRPKVHTSTDDDGVAAELHAIDKEIRP
jgi:flagellar assembly factor FliW